MFSVYGKSRISAKKQTEKQMLTEFSNISKILKKSESKTQDVKQGIIDNYVDELFLTMKPKRCTHEFSTPEIMTEAFIIMDKDKYNFSDLIKMKKQVKINSKGHEIKNKRTGKLSLQWVQFK